MTHQRENHHSRCSPECNTIGKRIELFPNGGRYVQQPGTHSIEEIKECPNEDKEQCCVLLSVKGKDHGDAPRDEVAASNGVWNISFEWNHGIFELPFCTSFI